MALWWSWRGGLFLMSEVPLYFLVDMLGLQYTSVNSGSDKRPGSPNLI